MPFPETDDWPDDLPEDGICRICHTLIYRSGEGWTHVLSSRDADHEAEA